MTDINTLRFLGVPEGYITGLGRDYPHPKLAHLYEGTFNEPGNPMCRRGWNRDNGQAYSIWRNNIGERGICLICLRRAQKGLKGVLPKAHLTQHAPDVAKAAAQKGVLHKNRSGKRAGVA
jgi:hypothetical protein